MAKNFAVIMGILFCLVGLAGFIDRTMMGMHLSNTQNLLHIISGIIAIYFGISNDESARKFCLVFGIVYAVFGIAGLFFGPGTFTLTHLPAGLTDDHVMKLLPRHLELGTKDDVVHIIFGAVSFIAGLMPRPVARKIERPAERIKEGITGR